MIKVLTLTEGSTFEFEGVEYTLVKVPNDGGWNWLYKGKYKLAQHFYFNGNPTVEKVEHMKKYLVI